MGGGAKDARRRLESELSTLLEQVDDEGLLFLIGQAQVLVHNASVERVNAAAQQLAGEAAGEEAVPVAGSARSAGSAGPAVTTAAIEEAGNAYHLTLGGSRHTLAASEVKELVRRCYEPETKSAALRALHRWLETERSDILTSAGIRGPKAPALDALFRCLRSEFQL